MSSVPGKNSPPGAGVVVPISYLGIVRRKAASCQTRQRTNRDLLPRGEPGRQQLHLLWRELVTEGRHLRVGIDIDGVIDASRDQIGGKFGACVREVRSFFAADAIDQM